jgi:hypothetical protein
LGEYNETAALRNKKETKHAVEVAEEDIASEKPKIRKLSKKLLLIAATDALDEPEITEINEVENVTTKEKKENKSKKVIKPKINGKSSKKVIIIESDEEDD